MDAIEQGVILLLKSGITGEGFPLPEQFDLGRAYDLMKRHNVLPLGYLGALHCGLSKDDPIVQKLYLDYCKNTIVSERQLAAVQKIYDAFEKNGIPFLPVKGCIMKPLYPSAELRSMGDADILIHMEQYDKIREIMTSLGYEEGTPADHALVWDSKALEVELHRKLIPSTDPQLFAYYGDGWGKSAYAQGAHHYMTTEDAYLFIFIHFVKHFTGAGIGLRHLMDLWIYRRTYPDMDSAYIRKELESLQLWDFYGNITALIQALFEDGTMNSRLEDLLHYILSCGIWGTRSNELLSDGVKRSGHTHSPGEGRLRWACSVIFPPLVKLRLIYPVLTRAPWLLPVFWVRRWFEVLLFRRKNIASRMENYKSLSDENITEHQKMLNEFGLRF